jgi:hypothetical protein
VDQHTAGRSGVGTGGALDDAVQAERRPIEDLEDP